MAQFENLKPFFTRNRAISPPEPFNYFAFFFHQLLVIAPGKLRFDRHKNWNTHHCIDHWSFQQGECRSMLWFSKLHGVFKGLYPKQQHRFVTHNLWFTGQVRVGLNFSLTGNLTNGYGPVAVVCEHVWRMLCSVRSTGAHVVQPFFLFFVFEVSPALSSVVSTCCFTGLVRVGLNVSLNGNLTNRYAHMGMVHENGWHMLCSVCTTDAHFARPFPCNS